MFPTKRKCSDVDLSYVSTRLLRPTTKRSKSTELLAISGGSQMKIYDFSDENYGEQFQQTTPNMVCNQTDTQRQFQTATRRMNKPRESSLDVYNDNTCVKDLYYDSQLPHTPMRQVPCKNTSPIWKSTPSLPTFYSSSSGYCKYSDTNNGRMDTSYDEGVDSKYRQVSPRTNAKQPLLYQYNQNRILGEKNLALLAAKSINVVDPLAKGNILSPGIRNNQAKHNFAAIPSCKHQSQNDIRNAMDRDINGRPLSPGPLFNTNGISVETLDVNLDVSHGEESPDSGQQLQDVDERGKDTHLGKTRHICTRRCCSKIQYMSYKNRFYIVLILNLLLIILNACGIPVIIKFYNPGEDLPDRLHCIECNNLNPSCDPESLGFIRKAGDQCCVMLDGDKSLYASLLKTADAYIDCSLQSNQDTAKAPVAQYRVDKINALDDRTLIWSEYPDVPPLGFGPLGYSNSEIIIPKTGYYFIYITVQFKKRQNGGSSVGFSIMKNNKLNDKRKDIDNIIENPFGEGTLPFSLHTSQLVTLHKFSKAENLFIKLNSTDNFDESSDNTKIVIFYVNLEQKHHNIMKNGASRTTND